MTAGSPGATGSAHTPVLLHELIGALNPRAGAVFVDGTFGGGGHSKALLDAADCVVWGIDRDPVAVAKGAAMVEAYGGRLKLLHGRFGAMRDLLRSVGVEAVDGVVLDLGLSTDQLDDPRRGFSFSLDGPLDMRMDRDGHAAAEFVNSAPESELAAVIYTFGEERLSRRIARAIVAARAKQRVHTTRQLAEIVRAATPSRRRPEAIDPATRTFQALRIHVNDELAELDRGLVSAEQILRPGGRLAVISFHSLEDRRVKEFLRARGGGARGGSRHLPALKEPPRAPSVALVRRRVTRPGASEVAANPRARSARMRVAERTGAPCWPAAGVLEASG